MRKNNKMISIEDLPRIVAEIKEKGNKIVLTTGTFDMIHEGHLEYLYQGKALGDILFVGVDTDSRTKIEKGPDRPLIKEGPRSFLVAAFECVDYVILNDLKSEEGAEKNALAKMICPDVLLISKDTKKRDQRTDFEERMKKKLGAYCGTVVCLPPQATTSTSNQIRTLAKNGQLEFVKKLATFFMEHGFELKPIQEDEKT